MTLLQFLQPKKEVEPEPKRPIRVLSVSDFHCGNVSGLTPPEYNPDSPDGFKAYAYRRGLWEWFAREVDKLKPIDICVANGDLIDGKGKKSGGNEQIVLDSNKQVEMAQSVLKYVDAKEYHFTYGTGYHTGSDDDWEVQVAQDFGGDIQDVYTQNINGLVMRWRHHTGTSQSPTGRATPLLRQQEWDVLWSVDKEFEKADVLVYGHAHYLQGVFNRYGTAVISPALQGLGGSQLGARRLGAIIDYGFLHFDVESKEKWTMVPHRLAQTQLVRSGIIPPPSE